MGVKDKENFYNVRFSLYSVYVKGEFLLAINWNERDESEKPEIDELFKFDDETLQLISDLIYQLTGKETDSAISSHIIKLREIVEKRDFLNKPLNSKLYFEYEDDLIENDIKIYSSISENYGEYISLEGNIKEDKQ